MGLFRGASRHVGGVLALALLTSSAALAGEKTVWLVRPLYPGQEALVAKIEQSLVSIIPDAQRGDEIIGGKELARLLGNAKLDALKDKLWSVSSGMKNLGSVGTGIVGRSMRGANAD